MTLDLSLKIHLTSFVEHSVMNRVMGGVDELDLEGLDVARREGPTSFIIKTKSHDNLMWRFFRVKISEID